MKVYTQRRNSNLQNASIKTVNDLNMLSNKELEEEDKRLDTMLKNSTLINSLPDKGKKLKTKKELIVALLDKLSSPEEKVTTGVKNLSLEENQRPNIRKKSIADANAEARKINKPSHLLQAGPSSNNDSLDKKAKVKMMSLEESMDLQKNIREEVQKDSLQRKLNSIKQKKTTSDMDTDDISLAMNKLNIGKNSNSSKNSGLDQYSDDEDDDEDNEDDDEDDDFDRLDSAYDDEEYDDDRSSIDEENFQER